MRLNLDHLDEARLRLEELDKLQDAPDDQNGYRSVLALEVCAHALAGLLELLGDDVGRETAGTHARWSCPT